MGSEASRVSAGVGGPADAQRLREIAARLVSLGSTVARRCQELIREMEKLAPIVNSSNEQVASTAPAGRAALVERLAEDIRPAGVRVEGIGRDLEELVIEMGQLVNDYRDLVEVRGSAALRKDFEKDLAGLRGRFLMLDGVSNVLGDFLDALHPGEALSAPLRSSIRPLRAGVRRTKAAVDIMRGW